jgi:hypothetical protein
MDWKTLRSYSNGDKCNRGAKIVVELQRGVVLGIEGVMHTGQTGDLARTSERERYLGDRK